VTQAAWKRNGWRTTNLVGLPATDTGVIFHWLTADLTAAAMESFVEDTTFVSSTSPNSSKNPYHNGAIKFSVCPRSCGLRSAYELRRLVKLRSGRQELCRVDFVHVDALRIGSAQALGTADKVEHEIVVEWRACRQDEAGKNWKKFHLEVRGAV